MYGYGYSLYNRIPFLGTSGVDPAAQAYFAVTGITGATQQAAIDNLVKGLKADGLWSKMKAVYPFVTDNRNRLSYTEDFSNNFWTSSATGTAVTLNTTTAPNGTLTADSINENTSNSLHYVGTANSMGLSSSVYTLSVYAKKVNRDWLDLSLYDGTLVRHAWFNINTGVLGTVQSGATSSITNVGNGWYRCTISMPMSASNVNFLGLGISNADGVSIYTGNGSTAFYLWGAQLELGSTATTYQPIATTQQAFIASQFKYNLINPVDSDAAFRLVFNGGWTHSSNGATPNGTNGYADTKLNAVVQGITNTNNHLSFYSRTAAAGGATQYYEMGSGSSGSNTNLSLWTRRNSNTAGYDSGISSLNRNTFTNTNGEGFYNGNSLTTLSTYFKNGVNQNTKSITASALESVNIFLGGFNESNTITYYSNKQCAFATIGDGLTDTEAANLYTRVQAYQTALSRQV